MRGAQSETCPVRALRAWLRAAEIMEEGPVLRRVTQWNTAGAKHLHPDAVRQLVLTRAAAAGVTGTTLEALTPHGVRAGSSRLPIGMTSLTRRSWAIGVTAA